MRGGGILQEVIWIPVPIEEVQAWFSKTAGTTGQSWYESHTINFAVESAKRIIGEKPLRSWVELYLGQEKALGRLRPDIVFETANEVWIVEVKDRRYEPDLQQANEQVQVYSRRLKELGWWPGKEHRLCVFWAYPPSHGKMYELEPWKGIASDKLDFTGKTRRK